VVRVSGQATAKLLRSKTTTVDPAAVRSEISVLLPGESLPHVRKGDAAPRSDAERAVSRGHSRSQKPAGAKSLRRPEGSAARRAERRGGRDGRES